MAQILSKVENFAGESPANLYHGSLFGLQGTIKADYPKAGEFYDFGKGFYCAKSPEAAKTTLCPYNLIMTVMRIFQIII